MYSDIFQVYFKCNRVLRIARSVTGHVRFTKGIATSIGDLIRIKDSVEF